MTLMGHRTTAFDRLSKHGNRYISRVRVVLSTGGAGVVKVGGTARKKIQVRVWLTVFYYLQPVKNEKNVQGNYLLEPINI